MGITQYFGRASASSPISSLFWPLFASNFVLSALSIANLGLISSMVGWLLDQKHNVHSYRIDFPGAPFDLNVEPQNLWTDHGHASNGVAGYGFFLGLIGMGVAWRVRRTSHPSKLLTALLVLHFLAVLFTLSAFIFVFVVTYQTNTQHIRAPVAANNQGRNYPELKWTPETWFKAVLDLPLADDDTREEMDARVANMVAWRWMLLPILVTDIIACGVTAGAWVRLRGATGRAGSANTIEK